MIGFFAAGQTADQSLHGWHARRAAHEDHLVNVALGDLRIRKSLLDRPDAALDKICRELLELGARELHLKMLGPRRIGSDERQTDGRLERARKFYFGFLRGFGESLQRLAVFS